MTSILARHRRSAREGSFTMTRAQQAFVDLTIATDPAAQRYPDLARQIAADHGFPISEPAPGLASMLHKTRG